ncbi:MAG: DUF3037 domain-containing protein [Bacteroidales bacterium]|nr:DUF3037 domain-containing protein [Bacteroidales bacterium]
MKAFYSLIKVSPNPSAGDSLTIGIVVADQSGVFFRVSENKIKTAHTLLTENSALVDYIIKQIANKAYEANKLIVENKTLLFEYNHLFSSEYFGYLSRYSNNLIQFTEPIDLFDTVTPENVEKLFCLFVDSEIQIGSKVADNKETIFIEKIETNLVSRVKERVHTNICFDDKIIPSLYFRFEMDCIGLNGAFTGAKSLYFNKTEKTIHTQVSDYITLITEIEKKYNKETDNSFYLIADEPERSSKEHLLWEKVKSLNKIKLITSDDTDEVAEYIEKSGSKKFITI